MSKRLVFSFVIAAAVAGGLYVVGDAFMAYKTRQILAGFQQNLPAGSSFTYEMMNSSLLLRQVTLTNLKIDAPSYALEASQVVLQGVPKARDHSMHLGHVAVSLAEVTVKQANTQLSLYGPFTVAAASASIDNLDLQTGVSGLALLDAEGGFDGAEATALQIHRTGSTVGFTLAALQLGNYRDKVLGSLHMEGLAAQLSAEDTSQKFALANLDATSIHFADIAANRSSLLSLLVRDVVGNISLRDMTLSGRVGGDIHIGDLQVLSESAGNGYRKSLQLDITDTSFPVVQAPAETRAALGLTSADGVLQTELHLSVTHDAETRILEIQNAKFSVSGQGMLSAKGALSGVSSLMLLENPAGMAALSFNGLEINYTDLGLAKRRVQSEAQRMAVMPDVYAEQVINRMAPQLEPLGQRGLRIRNALYAFLLDPHYLNFVAKPEHPVSMLQLLPLMRAPAKIADVLGIFVSSEPLQSLPTSQPNSMP